MLAAVALVALLQLPAAPPASLQEAVDPALRAAVERFYATQEAEDVEGYLALWAASARRPDMAMQLKFIFEAGDDKFSDLTIERVAMVGSQARVRVRVMRTRTDARNKRPDGSPMTFTSRVVWSLTFAREGEEWKVVREGTPFDELAFALLAAPTAEERKAIAAAEPDLLNDILLNAMARRGDAEAQKQQYVAARQTYERVLEIARMIGSKRGEGTALQNLGNAHYFLRQFPQALEMFEARLAIEREIKNAEGVANALSGVGSVRYALFEYAESLAVYREAAAVFEQIENKLGLASSLISTGNILYLQGDYEGAIADYRRSRELYRSLAYMAGEARALEGLGLCFSAQGDLGGALDAYAAVLEDARARSDLRTQATTLFSIGEIHVRLSNLDTARDHFDQSRGFYEKMRDPANVGRAWRGIALTDLIAGRFPLAEQEYVKSQAACTAVGEQGCIASAMVGEAYAQASQEHYDEAIATYGKAIQLITTLAKLAEIAAERRTLFEEAARAELGRSQALDGKKDYTAALESAGRAREQAVALKSDDVIWRALVAEARALRSLREPDRALKTASNALAAIERIRLNTLERPDARLSGDSVEAFALLAILRTEAQDTAGAFAAAEERRALALRLGLAANEREIHQGMTPEERRQEREMAGALVALHLKREREKALPKPDAARIEKLDKAIADATASRAAQQQRVFGRLPALRRWRALDPPAGAAALAEVVAAPGSLLIQFIVDEDDLLVMTAAPGESGPLLASHVSSIGRQKLAERVAALNESATLRDVSAWRKAALEITKAIPEPILKRLAESRRVVVIPDDVLWRVPFEALPLEDRFVADFVTVSYAASITALAPPEARTEPAAVPLMAAGAPQVGPAIRDRLKATAPGWTLRAPETAEREITEVAKAYQEPPATILLGAAATEEAFRADVERASLLHLTGPYRTNSASPLFTLLLLTTPGAERPDAAADGVVEARDIMNLRLRARAAVVTDGMAMSMRNAAAATPTLQWTWLAAGVPAIVLPRWMPDEAAGTALVRELHARLKAGDAPADALHGARMTIRKADATAAPYYWAGWMALGR